MEFLFHLGVGCEAEGEDKGQAVKSNRVLTVILTLWISKGTGSLEIGSNMPIPQCIPLADITLLF
jgi:hypothetical protein